MMNQVKLDLNVQTSSNLMNIISGQNISMSQEDCDHLSSGSHIFI